MKCLSCGFESPAEMNFCGKCGYELTATSDLSNKAHSLEEKLARIQRYLPEGLTKKILAQKGKIEGERKQVTVMFTDMEGFTPLVEKLGPEEAYSLLDQVYEILIHKVHDYEGTVNEMTGDGIMALFGAPIALEDAPQRAIQSALAIHKEITRFSDRIKQDKGISPIRMRIGIHTGLVVVGTLGNDLRVQFKAVGDTVNLASRMEGLAEPGTTYVTEDTFKLTEGFFRFEALGEKAIKGKEAPVKVYRMFAPSRRRTRFDLSAERGLTPFVGRERELELLLDGFERVKEGRGQAYSIIGEAGVGKSRLLYEFRKAVTNEDVTFLEGKCLSYGRGTAYHPLIDMLKSKFNVREDEQDFEIREKVIRGLEVLKAEQASTLPYLLELLSVKDSGIDRIPMSLEARKDRIIEALKQIVMKGSGIRPLVMAIEDIHWVDKSSEDALSYFLECIPGARVLLIFTYRPEFVHTWGGRSYHNQMILTRLSNRESLFLAAHLLSTENIDRELEELILTKTEGVPFFIEEFIKSLKDLRIIERKANRYHLAEDIQPVIIPSTIQDVIMARVDSLPNRSKEVLQVGAAIEREFSHELIKGVVGLPPEELLSHLSVLKESELLYERGIYPHSTYIFKHALTQEVVYDSILNRKKKELHEAIGNILEETRKDSLEDRYGILAEHFIASNNYNKAAKYSHLASKKSARSASLTDAISHAKKRVMSLEKLPQTDEVLGQVIDARTTLGRFMYQMSYISEAKETIDPIISLALRRGDKRRLSQIYTILGAYYYEVEEDLPKAFKHLEIGLQIAEEIEDIVSFLFANNLMGWALCWNCEFEKSYSHIVKGLDRLKTMNSLWLISLTKSNLAFYIYNYQGKVDLGYQTSDEAVRLSEESGDILSKSWAYTGHGISCYYKGFFGEAEIYLMKGIAFSERIKFLSGMAVGHQWLGHAFFDINQLPKSLHHYREAINLRKQSKLFPSSMNLINIAAARIKVINNEKDIDLESLNRCAAENRVKLHEGPMARYMGEVLLNMGVQYANEAESWLRKAIETDKKNGLMWHLGRDYVLHAEFLERKQLKAKAKEELEKAKEIFSKCGADGWSQRTKEALSEAYA